MLDLPRRVDAETIGQLSLSLRSLADNQSELDRMIASGSVKVPAGASKDEEEKILLELYGALSANDAKAIKGKGGSSSGAAISKDAMKIADLSEKPRKLAAKLVEKRLEVFSADRRKIMEELIKKEGGTEALQIAIWGEATRSHKDGGNYHWKIGAGAVLLDWQTAGKNHIHMTLRGRPENRGQLP